MKTEPVVTQRLHGVPVPLSDYCRIRDIASGLLPASPSDLLEKTAKRMAVNVAVKALAEYRRLTLQETEA